MKLSLNLLVSTSVPQVKYAKKRYTDENHRVKKFLKFILNNNYTSPVIR